MLGYYTAQNCTTVPLDLGLGLVGQPDWMGWNGQALQLASNQADWTNPIQFLSLSPQLFLQSGHLMLSRSSRTGGAAGWGAGVGSAAEHGGGAVLMMTFNPRLKVTGESQPRTVSQVEFVRLEPKKKRSWSR